MEMYYVIEYTPTWRFLKNIYSNSSRFLRVSLIIFKNLQLECILHYGNKWFNNSFSISSNPLSRKFFNHTFWNNMWGCKNIIIVIYYLNTKNSLTSLFLLFELVHQYVDYKLLVM